jgi:hypothetical protein
MRQRKEEDKTAIFFHLVYGLLLLSLIYPMHFLGFNVMPRRIPSFPDSFSLLINSSWLLVFAIILFVPYGHIFCIGFYFGGVLVSEALLFVSFFWTSFHSLSSITLGIISHEAFYLPDPCELTFANTLLLSNAAISLGITFTSLEISSLFYISLSFTLCSLFISLQGKEFRILALLINDSLYSCLFFNLGQFHENNIRHLSLLPDSTAQPYDSIRL